MPAKSAKQLRLMYAVMHGDSKAVPKKVAAEFIAKTSKAKRRSMMRKGK